MLSRPPAQLPFIWRSSPQPAPNTRTYFKKLFDWQVGQSTHIEFAADPTASLWVNGVLVLDRTQRFVAPHIPVEVIDLEGVLRQGRNVAVILHHWWGVRTFQRTCGGCPGVALNARGMRTDASWYWCPAQEYLSHPFQTIGHDGAERIRFPVLVDMNRTPADLHEPFIDERVWTPAQPVLNPVWGNPVAKETPPLKLAEASAAKVISCGKLMLPPDFDTLPEHAVGRRLRAAQHLPSPQSVQWGWAYKSRGTEQDGQQNQLYAPFTLVGTEGYLCFDFGRPVHGFPVILIESATAGVLEIGYCELAVNPLNGEPLLQTDGSFDPEFTLGAPAGDRVILRAGRQEVVLHDERTWRWLLLHWTHATDPIKIEKIACLGSQHDVCLYGSFRAEDGALYPLIDQCLIHAQVTMSDTYVDTPGREDAQWLEDIQYRARLSASWFADQALRQVTLRHAAEQQDPHSGLFRVFAPEDFDERGCQFLDWGMSWVGMLHDDWLWTGSTERINRYFSALERFMEGLECWQGCDGLLSGQNCLCDLRTSARARYDLGGVESIPNACYHGTLTIAAQMAAAIGMTAMAGHWRAKAEAVRKHFGRFLVEADACDGLTIAETWDAQQGAGGFGQAAVVSAAFHGLLEPQTQREVLRNAFTEPLGLPPDGMKAWNTPTYIYRLLRVLCESGLGELARSHLFHVYAPYLPDGPLPEYFQAGNGQPIDPTGSHGWAAVPLAWLHDTVLGVSHCHGTGAEPGGIIVRPLFAGWQQVNGTVATPFGCAEVTVDWDAMQIHVDGPSGVTIQSAFPQAEHLLFCQD